MYDICLYEHFRIRCHNTSVTIVTRYNENYVAVNLSTNKEDVNTKCIHRNRRNRAGVRFKRIRTPFTKIVDLMTINTIK